MSRAQLDANAVAAALQTRLVQLDVVGAGLGLRVGKDAVSMGAGCCDLRASSPVPVDGETLFQAGSISKTFTATLLVILAERQLLDLEERVLAYLPHLVREIASSEPIVSHQTVLSCRLD